MRVVIITPADLPVPSVLGGAIETLIDNYIKVNEKLGVNDLIVYSKYNKEALNASVIYRKTRFHMIRQNLVYRILTFLFRVLRKLKIVKAPYDILILNRLIKRDKPDVIIIEGNPTYVKYIKKRLPRSCPVIFHIHTMLKEGKYGFLADALEYSDMVIVVSDFIRSDLLQRFKVAQEKIKVVFNCAGGTFFNNVLSEQDRLCLRKKLEIAPSDIVLLFAGRLVRDKGLLELIKACKEIGDRIKFKLLIVGSFGSDFGKVNNTKNYFSEAVKNEIKGVEQNFIFCGFIQNEEILKYYSIADIAVVPSICEEAAGLVAIEAMAKGLPVIYSGKGGIKEYVNPDCGIMVNMDALDSVGEIATAILEIYDDRELRKRLSLASVSRSQLFNPKTYYESMNRLITSVTS